MPEMEQYIAILYYYQHWGYDVVRAGLDLMKQYESSFELPADFFESELIGVPLNRN